jgi:Tfp pilus assembly protein FimT
LIELLVVLAIVGILAFVGVSMVGNRQGAAVRSLLDEIEGSLNNASSEAAATGRDIVVETWGNWSSATPFFIAYGDNTLALNLAKGQNVDNIYNIATGTTPANAVALGQTVGIGLHYMPNDSTQARARVVPVGSTDWTTAMTPVSGNQFNVDINSVPPFSTVVGWTGQIGDATNLASGAATKTTIISGTNQSFSTTFCIEIVGTSPSAGPLPGSPMGLIFVPANGGTIYKFYNPGAREGNGQWRRI